MDSAKIFIDTDNEVTFILEKILSSRTECVCLVIPDRASLFTSISGLKLIKRVIDKSNKLLILVTLDENGAKLSTKAGLTVVQRVGEVTESMWEQVRKSKFEVMKKESRKVYYTPQIEKVKSDSVVEEQKQSSSSELVTELLNETVQIEPEALTKQEIPVVKIRVDDVEIKKEKVDEWKRKKEDVAQIRFKEIDSENIKKASETDHEEPQFLKSEINLSHSQNKSALEVTPKEDLKKDEKYETKVEETTVKVRMRKNPLKSGEISNLKFTVGKDISDQKKK